MSHPTFYRHKAKFYDSTKDIWVHEQDSDSDSEVDIQFENESSLKDHEEPSTIVEHEEGKVFSILDSASNFIYFI